jgi:hypothetical protein
MINWIFFLIRIFLDRITEGNYKDFLLDMPLTIPYELYGIHNGVPAHFSLVTLSYPNRNIPGR